jgi:hypothetical protein
MKVLVTLYGDATTALESSPEEIGSTMAAWR